MKRNRRSGVEDRWSRTVRDERGNARTAPSAVYGSGKRWRARYVDDDGREHAKAFATKTGANEWLQTVMAALVTGNYVDPESGKITFASFYAEWSARQVWVPTTRRAMDLAATSVTFDSVPLGDLRPSHIEAWVKAMQDKPLAPGTIKTRFTNVRGVIRAAVRDQLLARDVTSGVRLPRQRNAAAAMTIPAPAEVGALLREAEPRFVAFIALCAFGGLRLGEAAAVQASDVDFLRREIHIRRQVQRVSGGHNQVEIRAPKYGSERTVYAPDALLEVLAEHLRLYRPGDDADCWLFSGHGSDPVNENSVGYLWRKTREATGIGHRLHDLRHFYASGLINAGCDVVTVQRALGHHSATVTLNTYAHLWPDASDRTRKAAGELFAACADPAAVDEKRGRQ